MTAFTHLILGKTKDKRRHRAEIDREQVDATQSRYLSGMIVLVSLLVGTIGRFQ